MHERLSLPQFKWLEHWYFYDLWINPQALIYKSTTRSGGGLWSRARWSDLGQPGVLKERSTPTHLQWGWDSNSSFLAPVGSLDPLCAPACSGGALHSCKINRVFILRSTPRLIKNALSLKVEGGGFLSWGFVAL